MRAVVATSEIKASIRESIKTLSQEIRIEVVILYGSYVSGQPDEWSDFDIAVISRDFEGMPFWRRQQVLSAHTLNDPRLSPIGYSSGEYHKPAPGSFLHEIKRTGRVVYSAE